MAPPFPVRRRRSAPAAAAAVVAAVAAAAVLVAPAPAGVPLVDSTGLAYRWKLDTTQPNVVGGKVTYFADTSGLHDTINGPTSAAGAIQAAVQTWEVPTAAIRFAPDARPKAATGVNGLDRVNWIGWSSKDLGHATFAQTTPTRSGSQILDMDVVLNDFDFSWDTWTEGVPGDADIQSLVTHEWGHALGLDHVPLRASTMYFSTSRGVVSLRALAPDDVAQVGAIYPNQTFLDETGSVRGSVDVAGTKDDRGVHVVAVSVASGEPAASALTAPDGTFEIRGLPRGSYRLLAAPCVPLERQNAYWQSASTSFLPEVFGTGTGTANPQRAETLFVERGASVDAGQVGVATAASPFEPNESSAQAQRIQVGDAVCARFESAADQDWYVFHAEAGENLTLKVLAYEIGSDADPSLRLVDPGGQTIRTVTDIRDARFLRKLEGTDRDARIPYPGNSLDAPNPPWIVPASGDYRIRVGQDVPAATSQSFYVLFVTVATDSPSPGLTEVEALPDRVDADGASTATIVVRPRTEAGDPLGASASAAVFRGGDPAGSAAFSFADATFRLDVTAPSVPGREEFTARVSTASGIASTTHPATVVWVGPMDPARSTLVAEPRRIPADGVSQAALRFVPRDAQGEALGPGRAVGVAIDAPRGTNVGAAGSQADGTYLVPVTAGTEPGTSEASATVGAQTAVVTARIAFGFELTDVLTTAADDAAAGAATPGLPRAAAKSLASAAKRIQSALAAAGDTEHAPRSELRALSRARKALLAYATAVRRSKSLLADPGTTREIALATRASAASAIDRAAAAIRNGGDQRRVDAARALLALGDSKFGAGKTASAQAKFLAAFRRVFPAL